MQASNVHSGKTSNESSRQAGFAALLLVLLVAVVAVAIGYAGYQVAGNRSNLPVASTDSSTPAVAVKYVGQSAANGVPLTQPASTKVSTTQSTSATASTSG